MNLYDIFLGAEHEDILPPLPGHAEYKYNSEHYPFEEGSPSEIAVWSFSQGAASFFHSTFSGNDIEMRTLIKHKSESVTIKSKEKSLWAEKELELTI